MAAGHGVIRQTIRGIIRVVIRGIILDRLNIKIGQRRHVGKERREGDSQKVYASFLKFIRENTRRETRFIPEWQRSRGLFVGFC